MLKANKNRFYERIFDVYNRNLLKRRFHSFRISELERLRGNQPQVVYANHSSWWDGLIALEVSRAAGRDFFVMMEEKQLLKMQFFRRIGAFSVVRENARQAVGSLNYAAELLRAKPQRDVWIFPQGEIVPNDSRPLKFYRGLARLAEKVGECAVVPCAMRLEFTGEFKPEIFVKIGAAQVFSDSTKNSKNLTDNFREKLTATLDELKEQVVNADTAEFQKIF